MTYTQLKSEALIAMQAALAGQSYSINGITYTRQSIDALQRLIDWIDSQIAAETETSNGIITVII